MSVRQHLRAKQLVAEVAINNGLLNAMASDGYVREFVVREFVMGIKVNDGIYGAIIGKYRNNLKIGEYVEKHLGDRTISYLFHEGKGNPYLHFIEYATDQGETFTYTFLNKLDMALYKNCMMFGVRKENLKINTPKRRDY